MSPRAGDVLVREVLPIIAGVVPQSVRVVGSEDHEELIQDAIVIAAMMLDALERAGKQPIARSVAYYSIQRIKSGRRSYSSGRTDVYAPGTQLDGLAVVHSLDEVTNSAADDEEMTIGDMLAAEVEDPSVTAGRDIDWQELESHLDCRERGVVEGLAAGHGSSELSRRYGVSAPRITQIKDHIADEITGRWGEDVLEQVSEEPIWRSSLRAKEKCV